MNKINEHYVTKNVEEFIFGGNSSFTIRNEVSGKGVKYRIKANDKFDTWFVRVMNGNSFVYAGYIRKSPKGYMYKKGEKGLYEPYSSEIQGLCWMIRHANCMDSRVSLLHHGKCACCGRSLNDEESIDRGFGPVCYERVLARKVI